MMRIQRGYQAAVGVLALLCVVMSPRPAQASVAVLVEQPYGKLNIFDPGGHSSVYLDHVCAESPTKLRACEPGELGVVISRYNKVGGYDWLAMPLIPNLYAVDTAREIPATMDREEEIRIRDAYRRKYLEAIAPDLLDGGMPSGNWYELVGAAYDRTIYGFQMKTTAAQDAEVIALYNDRANKQRYNGMFINCADFARVVVNRYYPHAVRRNLIADFGVTSPKWVARSVSHYANKHPEAGLQVFEINQVKGDLPRSHSNTGVAEGLVKRYGLPLVVISPEAAGVVLAAYVGRGRFRMPKDAPVLNVSMLDPNGEAAKMTVVEAISKSSPEAAAAYSPAASAPAVDDKGATGTTTVLRDGPHNP
jgi:hypothetical protein